MTAFVAVQLRKEFRELLPWWGAVVGVIVACWALSQPDRMPGDLLYSWAVRLSPGTLLITALGAYAAGAVMLGAVSIGHEYSHHTLQALLLQPNTRAHLLLTKLAILVPMIVSIGILALIAFGADPVFDAEPDRRGLLMPGVLPIAVGVCLAPWLTMACRGVLAGIVFSAALSAFLWVAGGYLGLPQILVWLAILAFSAVGGVMTWRTFLRLEATGDSPSDVSLPEWLGRSEPASRSGRRRSPVWLLIKKELRLQELTFVLSGIYVVAWLAIATGLRLMPETFSEAALFVAAFLHVGVVPLLIGALASAEERRLGVADWQTLLPFAAWKQWAIKAGLSVSLALGLVVILPAFLEAIVAEPGMRFDSEPLRVVMLCLAGLYVSSLSRSGLRALLAAPLALIAAFFVGGTLLELSFDVASALEPLSRLLLPLLQGDRVEYFWWIGDWRIREMWAVAGFAVLLLRFAFLNHATTDRSRRRVARQFGWLCVYATGAALVLAFLNGLFMLAAVAARQ